MPARQTQNKANPDAPDVTAEQAAAPPAGHDAPPPPAEPGPGGGPQVQGGRLADLGPRAMPPGVGYAIANEPLFIVHPEAAAAPVRAFNEGDRVPAELVDKFGWHDLTTIPEWATAPPAPAPADETASEE